MGLAALSIVLAQLAQPEASRAREIAAAASASPRLPECADGAGPVQAGTGFWRRAVDPELDRYCDQLARGYASLAGDPEVARARAVAALAVLPERRGALLLRARADVALGQLRSAFADFVRLGAPSALVAPDALHDFALSAAGTSERAQAAAAYRLLASRVDLLPGAAQRQRVYVEAGVALMQLGASTLDESIANLKEARQVPAPPGLSAHVAGALALALDRQGHAAQARGLAAEVASWSALERALSAPLPSASAARRRALRASWPVLPKSELHAMLAMLLEPRDPATAAEHWTAFVDDETARQSPWLAHARAKLAALEMGRRRRGN